MARIKGKHTLPERSVAAALSALGIICERHCRDLPGRPDFVFRACRVAVFVDGDFWHGWRFPAWRHKLSVKWEAKIAMNRLRDVRTFRTLRRRGWRVIRLWEHQVESDLDSCINRVTAAIKTASKVPAQPKPSQAPRTG